MSQLLLLFLALAANFPLMGYFAYYSFPHKYEKKRMQRLINFTFRIPESSWPISRHSQLFSQKEGEGGVFFPSKVSRFKKARSGHRLILQNELFNVVWHFKAHFFNNLEFSYWLAVMQTQWSFSGGGDGRTVPLEGWSTVPLYLPVIRDSG